MRISPACLCVFIGLTITGCTTAPNKRWDPPFVITTFDIYQAKFIENNFNQAPEMRGQFTVWPRAHEIIIDFKKNLPPGKEKLFVKRMKAMKDYMRQIFKRKINVLVFRFPSEEIRI